MGPHSLMLVVELRVRARFKDRPDVAHLQVLAFEVDLRGDAVANKVAARERRRRLDLRRRLHVEKSFTRAKVASDPVLLIVELVVRARAEDLADVANLQALRLEVDLRLDVVARAVAARKLWCGLHLDAALEVEEALTGAEGASHALLMGSYGEECMREGESEAIERERCHTGGER